MSFEQYIRNGISKAYALSGLPVSQLSNNHSISNLYKQYAKYTLFIEIWFRTVDSTLQKNETFDSIDSIILIKNLDFDDLYSSSMVEEKEVKEPSIALYRLFTIEPVLSHLEEIAEMNERLRAKCEFYSIYLCIVIKEMNMSDRSLLKDSPIHMSLESPIPLGIILYFYILL